MLLNICWGPGITLSGLPKWRLILSKVLRSRSLEMWFSFPKATLSQSDNWNSNPVPPDAKSPACTWLLFTYLPWQPIDLNSFQLLPFLLWDLDLGWMGLPFFYVIFDIKNSPEPSMSKSLGLGNLLETNFKTETQQLFSPEEYLKMRLPGPKLKQSSP